MCKVKYLALKFFKTHSRLKMAQNRIYQCIERTCLYSVNKMIEFNYFYYKRILLGMLVFRIELRSSACLLYIFSAYPEYRRCVLQQEFAVLG